MSEIERGWKYASFIILRFCKQDWLGKTKIIESRPFWWEVRTTIDYKTNLGFYEYYFFMNNIYYE